MPSLPDWPSASSCITDAFDLSFFDLHVPTGSLSRISPNPSLYQKINDKVVFLCISTEKKNQKKLDRCLRRLHAISAVLLRHTVCAGQGCSQVREFQADEGWPSSWAQIGPLDQQGEQSSSQGGRWTILKFQKQLLILPLHHALSDLQDAISIFQKQNPAFVFFFFYISEFFPCLTIWDGQSYGWQIPLIS